MACAGAGLGARYVELPGDEHALYGQDENVANIE
jgi:hypothetical protein